MATEETINILKYLTDRASTANVQYVSRWVEPRGHVPYRILTRIDADKAMRRTWRRGVSRASIGAAVAQWKGVVTFAMLPEDAVSRLIDMLDDLPPDDLV